MAGGLFDGDNRDDRVNIDKLDDILPLGDRIRATARPVEHWELRQELDGVRLLVIGFGMASAGFSALALFFGFLWRMTG